VTRERPQVVEKRTSTLHDFPYEGAGRKCYHAWIINVAPPGRAHCVHNCTFCYAREAIYSDLGDVQKVYGNLPELVERDLEKLTLAPPVLLCTTSDPCQPVPEVRRETSRLVELLMRYGVSFAVTTKGDPLFLGELPGFWEYERKCLAISIEGPPEVLRLLSPGAAPYATRLRAVRTAAANGTDVAVRLDPYFKHVLRGLYGDSWWERTEQLLDQFAEAGAGHVTASTGRLDGRRSRGSSESMRERVLSLVWTGGSAEAAEEMARDYVFGWSGTCRGYVLRDDLRRELHARLRVASEQRGMTYATCQELPASVSDTPGIPHCSGFALPFVRKGADGKFHAVEGCTANCHVTCAGKTDPPCGQPELAEARPYRRGSLR
jgi:DNA repair photolyase